MSCLPERPIFRLLDAIVGWDQLDVAGLEGLDDQVEGVVLARQSANAVDPSDLLPFLPPARLARGCGRCEWFLVTPSPSRLLQLQCGIQAPRCEDAYPCDQAFVALRCPQKLTEGVAVAARRHFVAVSDRGGGEVRIFSASGAEFIGLIQIADAGAITFSPRGELIVAVGGSTPRLLRYSLAGILLGDWLAPLPDAAGAIDRLAFGNDGALWLVSAAADGSLSLWRNAEHQPSFEQAATRDLAASFDATTLVATARAGFSLRDSVEGPTCSFDWYGRPVESILATGALARVRQGQLLTEAVDSGRPRCQWHRVRVEATVPPGTSVSVAIATSEVPLPPAQGDATIETGWETFPAGLPHPADWSVAPQGSLDYLIQQPPGRFLHLRLRLVGNGTATPTVHRIRLDFPRSTSLEHLPPVYREDQRAEDFTERFLSLFDATVENLDHAIERFPALLDGAGVPDAVLPWLGGFLDLAFDASWSADRRRALLAAMPDLYRRRGTKQGLADAIRLVLGIEPAIQELASERAWGALARTTPLGSVRLFSRAKTRFTLGRSALSSAPLLSFGNPDFDPLTLQAWRLRVLIPGMGAGTSDLRTRLMRLVESQKPAHTIVTTRVGGAGFVVGSWSSAGVDTALAPLPAPVLGGPLGNARLSRATVLWTRRGGSRGSYSVGHSAGVGIHTVTN